MSSVINNKIDSSTAEKPDNCRVAEKSESSLLAFRPLFIHL